MPITCCGKQKPHQNPDQNPSITVCQNNAWDNFCNSCPGCLGNQMCIDELFDAMLDDWGDCSISNPSAVESGDKSPYRPSGRMILTLAARLARVERELGISQGDCGCKETQKASPEVNPSASVA